MNREPTTRIAARFGARIMTGEGGHEYLCFPPGAIEDFRAEVEMQYVKACTHKVLSHSADSKNSSIEDTK